DADWQGTVTSEDLERAGAQGAFGSSRELVIKVQSGRPRAGVLSALAISHCFNHMGEAVTIRSMGGFWSGACIGARAEQVTASNRRLEEGLTPFLLFRCAARSALLLPEGIARRVDAHHDSTRVKELRVGGELATDSARLVQQRVCDEHVRLRPCRRWGHGSLNRRRLAGSPPRTRGLADLGGELRGGHPLSSRPRLDHAPVLPPYSRTLSSPALATKTSDQNEESYQNRS